MTVARRTTTTRFLVTSRCALEIAGEAVWRLAPLEVPPRGAVDLDVISNVASVRLFFDRAQLVRPRWTPDANDVRAAGEICRRLDGLPLAIELAAARLASMSVDELLEALERRFEILASRASVAGHHGSMLAAIETSYELLSPSARSLLRRLSITSGEAGPDLVQALARSAGLASPDQQSAVDELVRNSLLDVREQRRRTRYVMLETIREYARERLAGCGEEHDAWSAVLSWAAALVKEAGPSLEGPDQNAWLERIDADHDTVRGALEWATLQDPAAGLKVASLAARFWSLRGHLSEGASWCTRLLDATPNVPAVARGRALTSLGGLLELRLGRLDRARERLTQARELLRDTDARSFGWATFYLALARFDVNELTASRTLLEEARAFFEQAGDIGGFAFSNLMWGYTQIGDDPASARSIADEIGAQARGARHLNVLGHALELRVCADLAAKADPALAMAVEALDGYASLGNGACATHALEVIAFGLMRRGANTEAATLFGAADAERRRNWRAPVPHEDARAVLSAALRMSPEDDRDARLAGASMSLANAMELARSVVAAL